MPITAQTLVTSTRDLVQVFGDSLAYRDGFAADAAAGGTPILTRINEFVSSLAKTGYNRVTSSIDSVSGTDTYSLLQLTGQVYSVYFASVALKQATRDGLDASDPDWRLLAAGTPKRYIREGRNLILSPKPNVNTANAITYNAAQPEPRLTLTTDTLAVMPEALQDRIPYGAALLMCHIDAEHPVHGKRVQMYMQVVADLIAELMAQVDSDSQDFATALSLDDFIPQKGGPQVRRGVIGQSAAPIGAGKGMG